MKVGFGFQILCSGMVGVDVIVVDLVYVFGCYMYEQFGIGFIECGVQWLVSGCGFVEVGFGDLIIVNFGEVYDGMFFDVLGWCWCMFYVDLVVVLGVVVDVVFGCDFEFELLVICDVVLVVCFCGFFDVVIMVDVDLLCDDVVLLLLVVCLLQLVWCELFVVGVGVLVVRECMDDDLVGVLFFVVLVVLVGLSCYQFLCVFSCFIGLLLYVYLLQWCVQQVCCFVCIGLFLVEVVVVSGFVDQSYMMCCFVCSFGFMFGVFRLFGFV